MSHRIALLVTGASGMLLPRHFLAALAARPEVEQVHLVVSAGASQVLRHELGWSKTGAGDLVAAARLDQAASDKIIVHRDNELDAPIASGSYRFTGAVILPCSAGTLGAIAAGQARTLVHRTAAVVLKERRPLVLGFRETPLSILHLENLRRVTAAGAVVVPPIPAFYIGGEEMERFLDHYALRIFDQLGLEVDADSDLRWPTGEGAGRDASEDS